MLAGHLASRVPSALAIISRLIAVALKLVRQADSLTASIAENFSDLRESFSADESGDIAVNNGDCDALA